MTETAYDRAVDIFEALLRAPTQAVRSTPAELIRSAGVAPSSGYRHVTALEAEGFLRRDEAGIYLPGAAAIRTGLNGFGLGHMAPLAQPILLQLRQNTQHSSFLAVVRDMDVHIGPHSVGRDTRNVPLSSTYTFETIPDLSLGSVADVALRTFEEGIARRVNALVVPVFTTPDTIVVVGMILVAGRPASEQLTQTLRHAGTQISTALGDV